MQLIDVNESTIISKFNPHFHENYEITLVLQGEMKVNLGEKVIDVTEGDIMIIPPNTPHSGSGGTNYMDIYLKAIDMDFYDSAIVHDHDGSMRNIFLMLKKIVSEKETNFVKIADKLLDLLCEYMKKYLEKDFKYDFVVKIKNKIYENIPNAKFSISEEVRNLGFNVDYFRRCFREELLCTPLEYMTKLRIERAKKLLTQRTFGSVEKVAGLCGFADCFYFSKIFKKCTGLSPRDYRKAVINEY